MKRAGVWLPPALVLCALAVVLALPVLVLTNGRGIADDAPQLLGLVRHPFSLWQSFVETGLHSRWGSFPPLLPPLFGLAIWPWLFLPDFWSIRLGVLGWTLIVQQFVLRGLRAEGTGEHDVKQLLWLYALLPSVWCAIAFIPQEEIYVASFGLALWFLGRSGRWSWVPILLVVTALSAKYFMLILILPLAVFSPRPLRNLFLWCAVAFGTLALYISYHYLRFGLTPILSHMLTPEGSISIWALLWKLNLRPPLTLIRSVSVLMSGGTVLALCLWARQRGVPLVFMMAASLYATLILISITFPAYVLWNIPLVLLCLGQMRPGNERYALVGLLFAWGFAEWGANFFRGVHLALTAQRETGKEVFAARMNSMLGADFPYEALGVVCVAAVIACGTALVVLLLREGARLGTEHAAAREPVAPR